MNRLQIMVLFGGESSEHDVSIASARNVYAALDNDKYDTYLCYITKDGEWLLVDSFDDVSDPQSASELLPVLGSRAFYNRSDATTLDIDVVIPILHGRNGEDGTVQGLAQLLHIPMVGCDVTASGIAMNKLACKQVLAANELSVIPFLVHRQYEDTPDFEHITSVLGDVLFVKPARAGSSVGVSKVRTKDELIAALKNAHIHDPIVLIEKAIEGRELEVAVLGTPPHHRISGVGEIVPGEEFYTYDDKYSPSSSATVHVTADIDTSIKDQITKIAEKAYIELDCRGMARIDFIVDGDGRPYVMEVNTIPGFTNISMYPKLWREQGVGYSELLDILVEDAYSNGTMNTITEEGA